MSVDLEIMQRPEDGCNRRDCDLFYAMMIFVLRHVSETLDHVSTEADYFDDNHSTLLFNDLWTHNIDTIAKFVLHEFGKEHSILDSPDSVLSYLEARIEALSNTTNTDSLELIKMLHESLDFEA
jgi:hypothetical protein